MLIIIDFHTQDTTLCVVYRPPRAPLSNYWESRFFFLSLFLSFVISFFLYLFLSLGQLESQLFLRQLAQNHLWRLIAQIIDFLQSIIGRNRRSEFDEFGVFGRMWKVTKRQVHNREPRFRTVFQRVYRLNSWRVGSDHFGSIWFFQILSGSLFILLFSQKAHCDNNDDDDNGRLHIFEAGVIPQQPPPTSYPRCSPWSRTTFGNHSKVKPKICVWSMSV